MYHILVNAYAVSPTFGSEPGMGWNWIAHLSKYCKLHVITEGKWQDAIEAERKRLPWGENLTMYYNPLSRKIRTICARQGDWRFYWYYARWQRKTLKIAEEIMQRHPIDLAHQLNMIGFREPGRLWKLNLPFVWGPIGGITAFPEEYIYEDGWKTACFFQLKNQITRWQFSCAPIIRRAFLKADALIAATRENQELIRRRFHREALLINATGCIPKPRNSSCSENKGFRLLWVGKFDFRKQLGLALQTVALLKDIPDLSLEIVGEGTSRQNMKYREMAARLGIAERCIWHGKMPNGKVKQLMRDSNLLFFTSVNEGTPHVVLEAVENYLPVLCFRCCGQGDVVDSRIGNAIPLCPPTQASREFARQIASFHHDRIRLKDCSESCKLRQQELSWDIKARQMLEIYHQAIMRKCNHANRDRS